MDNKIKNAFEQIHADEGLKERTKETVIRRMRTQTQSGRKVPYRRFAAAAAGVCVLFLGGGGIWVYLTPTAAISIDVNPSIELGVNRFDRVVSVKGYNDDGRELAVSLNVRFMDYNEAVDQILTEEKIAELLSQDEVMTIAVVGSDSSRCSRMLSQLESCTESHQNVYCYSADSEEMEQAHHLGLSYGKYRAFLDVQELDLDITPEEIQGMTMREIRELTGDLSCESRNAENDGGNGQAGEGNGHGHGHGRGEHE